MFYNINTIVKALQVVVSIKLWTTWAVYFECYKLIHFVAQHWPGKH